MKRWTIKRSGNSNKAWVYVGDSCLTPLMTYQKAKGIADRRNMEVELHMERMKNVLSILNQNSANGMTTSYTAEAWQILNRYIGDVENEHI